MACISDVALGQWLSGTLSAQEHKAIVVHVETCASCREIWAAVVLEARATPGLQLPPDQPAAIAAANARYTLKNELVRGGMGRILRADDRVLQREVAIKCLREDHGDPARFAREIAVLSRLSHPAIVAIFDAGWLAPDFPYFAMPLLQGETLEQHLQRPRDATYRLALMRRLMPIINAVAYAHNEGILHRDIKPQNIFVGQFDECVLLDWGLAADASRPESANEPPHTNIASDATAGLTRVGQGMGTVGFSAPEQLAGHRVDERADVYGLGAVLYYVLTNQAPTSDALVHVCALTPALPNDLGSVIMRALAPAATDRYASAAELATELERYYAGLLVTGHHYSPREIIWRWLRSHRALVAVATVTVLAVAASTGVAWRQITHERDVAVSQRAQALASQRKSQALSTFVLVDVQAKVEQLGRLDLLGDLATAVAQYLDDSDAALLVTGEERANEKYNQARLQLLLGDVAHFAGEAANAVPHYEQANVLLEQADQAHPLEHSIKERCRGQLLLSEAYYAQGEKPRAEAALQACVTRAASALATTVPQTSMWDETVYVLAQAHMALADLARDRDRRLAISRYQEAIATLHEDVPRISAKEQHNATLLNIAIALRLANVYRNERQLALAEPFLAQAMKRSRQLVHDSPRDIHNQDALIASLIATAQHYAAGGEQAPVVPLLREATALAEPLAANDPGNLVFAQRLATIWQLLAEYVPPAQRAELLQKTVAVSQRRYNLLPNGPSARSNFISDGIAYIAWLREELNLPAAKLPDAAALCADMLGAARQRDEHTAQVHDLVIVLVNCADVDDAQDSDAGVAKRAEAYELATRAAIKAPSPYARLWALKTMMYWLNDQGSPAAVRPHLNELTTRLQAVIADGANGDVATSIALAQQFINFVRNAP